MTHKTFQFLIFILCVAEIFGQRTIHSKQMVTTDSPDYSLATNWNALPFRKDAADYYPKNEIPLSDSLKEVDVFYVYPTLYTHKKEKYWNANIEDKKLNKRIDKYPVKYQASVFNEKARVYVPRYRQAHIDSYYDTLGNGKKAFDLAYSDVKSAFTYYLKHYNQGRPIIIASHSQGSTHTIRLLQDFFDNPESKKQLVAAYIIGMEVHQAQYAYLTPCQNSSETNCYITWASYHYKATANSEIRLHGDVCINPISWTMKKDTVSSNGGILLNIQQRHKTTAFIKDNYLTVKTDIPLIRNRKNLHVMDYNLFWYDIRKNVAERIAVQLYSNQK